MKLRKLSSPLFVSTVFAFGMAACGGSQPAPESAPAASATPEPDVAPPASAAPAPTTEAAPAPEPSASAAPAAPPSFDTMTDDQKKELMKTVVLPHMKGLFQDLDSKRYAEMNCTTCHGEGAKKGVFDMPNPKLPKLDPKDGFAKHVKANPKVTKFMMEQVAPEMAKLLNVPPYDPATNKGFGCFDCHTMAGKK